MCVCKNPETVSIFRSKTVTSDEKQKTIGIRSMMWGRRSTRLEASFYKNIDAVGTKHRSQFASVLRVFRACLDSVAFAFVIFHITRRYMYGIEMRTF